MSGTLAGGSAVVRRGLAAVVCLIVAAAAYIGATGLLGSLYDFRSPMSTVPDPAAAPLGAAAPAAAQSRRVVAVLVDGLRVDTAADATTMPFLAELRARGASATMGVRTPSYSVPGWTVLMTGAWTELHGGLAMNPPEVPPLRPGPRTASSALPMTPGCGPGCPGPTGSRRSSPRPTSP